MALIKLVVMSRIHQPNAVLGCIFPERPKEVHVIQSRCTVIKSGESTHHYNKYRLASKQDFEYFHVVSDGFMNSKEYEYARPLEEN
tara:strand:+ start:270 stop:527 length:258 start_codon:yes stop_codon:yes gene_type:complete